MPRTKFGKWSTGLFFLFVLCFITFIGLVAAGYHGGDTFFNPSALTIPGLLGGIFVVSSFITGLISIIKSKERSALVIVETVIGFFFTFLVLGEFIYPH
jgi:lipopolysaccharide export LptBFGC system permease protein LptF